MTTPVIDNYFVCIGAQKSGTTWLARVLAGHPDLFLMPVKEIHYFDHVRGVTEHLSRHKRRSRYRKYFQRALTQPFRLGEYRSQWRWYRDYMRDPVDDAWYADLFRHRGGRRMAGEVTPEYAILGEEGLQHITRLAPAARVIFIMRNPVTRAWSQVLHICRAEGRDANREAPDALIRLIDTPQFRAFGDYPATLAAMEAVFPASQRLLLFYEDVHKDRSEALARVCAFLDVPYLPSHFADVGRRFNRSETISLPDPVRAHLREVYRPVAAAVRARVGRIPQGWIDELDLPTVRSTR